MDVEPMFYVRRDNQRMWRWSFRAANSKIIAQSSEGYHNIADCEKAIELVKTFGPSAPVMRDKAS